MDIKLLQLDTLSNNTLSNLQSRDVALWIHGINFPAEGFEDAISFLGLPWRLILFDSADNGLVDAFERSSMADDELARKRGFVHVVDGDPSRFELPPRCLPVYLLQGRHNQGARSSFETSLRRMTMLEKLRQCDARELVVFSSAENPLPQDLIELWSAGYRAKLTFVSELANASEILEQWLTETILPTTTTLIPLAIPVVMKDIVTRYFETYPEERQVVRMRDVSGRHHLVDITEADELERPILDSFKLVEERDLVRLTAEDLSQQDFVQFFENPGASWRPYAAGLPWIRTARCQERLQDRLQKLELHGSDENCVAFIASEPGAGGTTLAHHLAWESARQGYPTLVAKAYPFIPSALSIVNFLTRANQIFSEKLGLDENLDSESGEQDGGQDESAVGIRRFETPWVIVFDTLHWQNRSAELLRFRNELSRSGRPVCILVVTSTVLDLQFYNSAVFEKLCELGHAIDLDSARELGRHLNEFLRYFGRERTDSQWARFYEEHTVRYLDGVAAFWVTLSFWIKGQYDLSESIQEWIYRAFKEQQDDRTVQIAILQIAAMSSERLPLPQALLPKKSGQWPVWQLIDDRMPRMTSMGLTNVRAQGEQHWALVHDILGRLLINALFYDFETRRALGFAGAQDAEHLRFLVLKGISANSKLAEVSYRTIAEEFATEIFKVDPDAGKGSFTTRWREVLDALDNMPQLLRETSRVFRHHSAISRRRIAKLSEELYDVTIEDRIQLLSRAIGDINHALKQIPYVMGTESDLNLLNSLARAYFDLAEVKQEAGASSEETTQLRHLAHDATRRAYRENPTNSFVIETYVQSLLQSSRDDPQVAVHNCISALGTVYSILRADAERTRTSQLERLANDALEILLKQGPKEISISDIRSAVDLLVHAWLILARGKQKRNNWSLAQVPKATQKKALEVLANPIGEGNLQILHLRYDLTSNCFPDDYGRQMELLEPLRLSDSTISPQLQLEYAILLFQNARATEGNREFRSLREQWRTSEQFVSVPERLRWLRTLDRKGRQIVNAVIASDQGTRAYALVRDFSNARVPFRPEEHGFRDVRPGFSFRCYVSFGHNGPFLRPLTARQNPTIRG